MFGHHNLYRDGVPAKGVIIRVAEGVMIKDGHSVHERIVDGGEVVHESLHQKVFYDVVADVDFGDGTTGRHSDRLWRSQAGECAVGDLLPVRYNRNQRDKIAFDLPELEANRFSPKGRADGRPAAGSFGPDDVRELLAERTDDPANFADHLRQLAVENGTAASIFASRTSPAQESESETGFPIVDLNNGEPGGA
jgi:hypothetical protein